MSGAFRVGDVAGRQLDDIYSYTRERWGEAQAERYIRGMFEQFQAIADRRVSWRAIPAEFGVEGYLRRHKRHVIYWKVLVDGAVGVVTVLHERMHQIERLRTAFED